ncbi:hypothetical protein OCU04_011065 [Sclerotinia nivalis]|uniref:Uncharacterized protein n=1 Tax=Sclerotinia nivalis TaxID=352851 RepID=A0A9X0ADI6_9HELO|nr:hypothetical protein OCU04_011065 [Sclerotinia nivalis]
MDSSATHNYTHQNSTFNSPKVHTPCRTYHVPSNPPFVYHDNEYTESRTISTRASLPTLQSTMYTQETSNLGSVRPASSSTSRRSVSGMKQLLPLKLASSQISDTDSWPTSRPTLSKRTTFGQSGRLGDLSNSGRIAERRWAGISRLAIQPTRYRDTPIISKPTIPLLGSPLFQDNCTKCSDEVACTTSCIIDEYEGFSDSSSSEGYSSDYSHHHTQSAASSPISSRRRYRPDSDFSFKCLGEPNQNPGSSWLGSPLKPRAIPRLSTLDIEEWLGDSESMCGSSDDEDSDDSFACATALAPAKAQVVQVNHKQSPRLSITIPTRSTSIAKFKHSNSSALRKLTSRSPLKTSLTDDLAMSSPPTSPEEPAYKKFPINNQEKVIHSPIDLSPTEFSPTPASPDTILDIVAAIEESTSNFPSKMLLVDTPCISSIRSHLKATSATNIESSQKSPPPPPPSTTAFNQIRPKGLNRRNRPQTICLSPTSKSKSFNSQIPTTPPSTPPFSPDFSLSSFPSKNKSNTTKPTNKSSILPTFSYQLAAANLQPLHAIFPISSDFLRSALYAHILAFIFLQSLPSSTDPSSSSSQLHKTTSNSTTHPPCFKKQPSYNPSFSYHNTSIVGIPAKAASTLGLSISTSNSSSRRNGNGIGHFNLGGARAAQNKKIEHNLRTCIAKLLKGMQGRVDVDPRDGSGNEVEGWVLRSLVEVVKGCEGI